MAAQERYLISKIEEGRFALPLAGVHHVIPAMLARELPGAPELVIGAIDFRGEILPVVSLSVRFGGKARPLRASDQLIVAQTGRRRVALMVDGVETLRELCPHDHVDVSSVLPDLPHLRGLLRQPDGLVLIADLERLLSLAETERLDSALAESAGP